MTAPTPPQPRSPARLVRDIAGLVFLTAGGTGVVISTVWAAFAASPLLGAGVASAAVAAAGYLLGRE